VTSVPRHGSPIRVLFVCTGNSARSVMAEALLRRRGGSDFEVHSAGTKPRGINPLTVRILEEAGLPTDGLRSKSVNDFLDQRFDYVVTVCDEARQVCPVFPGSHQSMHWGYEDPALATGSDDQRLAVFRRVFTQLGERIGLFVPLAVRVRAEGAGVNEAAGAGRGQ
jgi:arsenate reductase